MGVLDKIFSGANGISALLHRTLGGTATIRIASFTRDEATGALLSSYEDFEIPFVPNNVQNSKNGLNAPNASRSDVRTPQDILLGTFPCASLDASIKPERDLIVYDGIPYVIETIETLNVGDANVQYSITARRC